MSFWYVICFIKHSTKFGSVRKKTFLFCKINFGNLYFILLYSTFLKIWFKLTLQHKKEITATTNLQYFESRISVFQNLNLLSMLTVKNKINPLIHVWEEGKFAKSGAFDINWEEDFNFVFYFFIFLPATSSCFLSVRKAWKLFVEKEKFGTKTGVAWRKEPLLIFWPCMYKPFMTFYWFDMPPYLVKIHLLYTSGNKTNKPKVEPLTSTEKKQRASAGTSEMSHVHLEAV